MNNKQSNLPKKELNFVFSLYKDGHYQDAINRIKALNEEYPNVPLLFNLVGACYKELGQLEGAAKMFSVAVSLNSNYAEAHFNLGVILKELGQVDESIECYKKAITIQPNYPSAHNNLGNILKNIGRLEEAIENLEWAIAYVHDFAEAHNNLGLALSDYGRPEAAIKCFNKAIKSRLDYDNAYFNLAIEYKNIGNKEGFITNIEKAIAIRPDWGDAYLHLSRVKKYEKNDKQIAAMIASLAKPELSLIDRIALNFALAHVYENLEDYDEQFKFLNEANKLRKEELNYFFEKDQKLFDRIKEVFQQIPPSVKQSLVKKSKIRPIFILGMPRSGTSLVHQIIDSHPKVYGAGELNDINKFVYPLLKKYKQANGISEKNLISIRQQYIGSLINLKVNEKIIVDKMPLNFRHIGFILSAFPDAKIIHMNRDPRATCWSIYKYYFNGNAYSYNQEDLAKYYMLYKELMVFWNKKFPDKIYDVCYEDLTANQEIETRKLLKYCDLDWDKSCLNFHKNQGVVKTTSALQVRQKIYQGSSEIWKKYESYLQPLLKGLDSDHIYVDR